MALHGIPNDLLQNLSPIALIIFISLLDSILERAHGTDMKRFILIHELQRLYTQHSEDTISTLMRITT